MRQIPKFIISLLLLIIINNCKNVTSSFLSQQADSLILEVTKLNNSIVSANLDSIQNLYMQITEQHGILEKNLEKFPEFDVDEKRYSQLDSIMLTVGFCLDACNDFHSEVSVIENHLRIISDEITESESPDSILVKKLEQESSLLADLITRIAQRMNLLNKHLESYDSIQPVISGYIEQIGNKDPNN
jgi:hypothetical protein